jgi:PAS domain S-box-containing protein
MYIALIYLFGFTNPTLVAIATAWFAIFMTIGVVASSYANQLIEERTRIRNILENSQDGIFCFDRESEQILEINPKCAQWLKYERNDLIGRNLRAIWSEPAEREQFIARVRSGQSDQETEGLFRSRDGTLIRLVISVVLVTRDRVLCSAIDITGSKIVDEEIRKTLEDLEEQVRARTAHLEKINEELQAEILERRGFERTILARQEKNRQDMEDDE